MKPIGYNSQRWVRQTDMLKKILKSIYLRQNIIAVFLIACVSTIFLFSVIGKKEVEENSPIVAKRVEYLDSLSANIIVPGKIVNSPIFEIKANVSGVVGEIKVKNGQKVKKGQEIAFINDGYTGTSGVQVQLEIAKAQLENTTKNYDKELQSLELEQQRAQLGLENIENLRQISESALNDTADLIENIEKDLADLKQNNEDGKLDSQIRSIETSLAGLKDNQRNLSYKASKDSPGNDLQEVAQQISLKQIEIRKSLLDLNMQVSRLNYESAQIQARLFMPQSSFEGVVESIEVIKGQQISPGQTLAVIKNDKGPTKTKFYISKKIYPYIDQERDFYIISEGEKIKANLSYISSVPLDGELHYGEVVSERLYDSFVDVQIPISAMKTETLIPLSAVRQGPEKDFVMIEENNKAQAYEINIKRLIGDYVSTDTKIVDTSRVIISRNVKTGEKISAQ